MKFTINKNTLIITTSNQEKNFIKEQSNSGKNYNTIISNLFEKYFINKSYYGYYASDAGYLSDTFMISEKPPIIKDSGEMDWKDLGKTWILDNCRYGYNINIDELKELSKGKLILQLLE